jgi:hypothetical protein
VETGNDDSETEGESLVGPSRKALQSYSGNDDSEARKEKSLSGDKSEESFYWSVQQMETATVA